MSLFTLSLSVVIVRGFVHSSTRWEGARKAGNSFFFFPFIARSADITATTRTTSTKTVTSLTIRRIDRITKVNRKLELHICMRSDTHTKPKKEPSSSFSVSRTGAWMHYYPRVCAASSLSSCCRIAYHSLSSLFLLNKCDGSGACDCRTCRTDAALAHRLTQMFSPLTRSATCGNGAVIRDNNHHHHHHYKYNANANDHCILIAASAMSIVEALLRHLRPARGALVLVPGLLLSPHTLLPAVLDAWQLRVVGYDVDFVTMRVDLADVRRKVLHNSNSNSKNNKSHTSNNSCALLVLAGVGGRFLCNAPAAMAAARAMCTLSLEPVHSFHSMSSAVDLRILSMDAAGACGGICSGAVACAAHPLLARSLRRFLRVIPRESPRAAAAAVARHVALRAISDSVGFRLAVTAAQVAGPARDTDSAAARIAASLCPPQSLPHSVHSSVHLFTRPGPARLAAMAEAMCAAARGGPATCVAQWTFLSRGAAPGVECVSLGDPRAPWHIGGVIGIGSGGVIGIGSGGPQGLLLLRVAEPWRAARAAQSAGFDAVALRPVAYTPPLSLSLSLSPPQQQQQQRGGGEIEKEKEKEEQQSKWCGGRAGLALQDAVVMPDCPKCAALAAHGLFVPLPAAMKARNRERLTRLMRSADAAPLFRSPCDEFHKHVRETPRGHAYRSAEVDAMLAAWAQRGEVSAFTDPMPLLVGCILGPVPGYLLSKI